MQNPELIELATNWINCFNTKNINGLLSLYHENAEHYSPKLKLRLPQTNGRIKGIEELRKWWEDAFERIPDLHYTTIDIIANENKLFIEYTRTATGDEDLRVAEVILIEDNKIISSRVYHS
jgi:predicted ester cyclase